MSDSRRDDEGRLHLLLADVDRQVERGALFDHGMFTETLDRMHQLAAWVWTAIQILADKGVVDDAELKATHAAVTGKLAGRHWSKQLGFAINADRSDKRAAEPALVDCDARRPQCRTVCCHMSHPLQITDLHEGIVKWDHGRPYFIRHDPAGACVHLDGERHCGVFADRPLVCRSYTCEHDKRVWKDFEARIPNTEVIDAIIAGTYVEKSMMEDVQVEHTRMPFDE